MALNALQDARLLYQKLQGGLQGAGNAIGNFVQQNPTPMNFLQTRLSQAAQPIQRAIPQIQQTIQQIPQRVYQQPIAAFPSPSLKNIAEFIPSIWQVPAQFGAGLTLSAKGQSSYQPSDRFSKALMGNAPVKNIQGQGADVSQFLKNYGVNPKIANPVGAPLVLGAGLLNFTGLGGGKSKLAIREVINLASKVNTAEEFAKSLNTARPEIKVFVKSILKDTKNPINTIEDLFNAVKKPIAQATKEVGQYQVVNPQTPITEGMEVKAITGDGKTIEGTFHVEPGKPDYAGNRILKSSGETPMIITADGKKYPAGDLAGMAKQITGVKLATKEVGQGITPPLTPSGGSATMGVKGSELPSTVLNAGNQLLIDAQKLNTAQIDALNAILTTNGKKGIGSRIKKSSTPINVSGEELKMAVTSHPILLQSSEIQRALNVAQQKTSSLPMLNPALQEGKINGQLPSVGNTIMPSTKLLDRSGLIKSEGGAGGAKIIPQEAKSAIRISKEQLGKPQIQTGFPAKIQPKSSSAGVPSEVPLQKPGGLTSQTGSSKVIIAQESKYSFNINKKRLDLTPQEKQTLETTVNAIKPELQTIKGKVLSNDEVLKAAKTSDILSQITTREQTLQAEAATLKARQRLVSLDKNIDQLVRAGKTQELKTQMGDLIDSLRVVSSNAADSGRKLQSFAIEAGDESIRQQVLKEIGKTNATTEQILKEAVNVDWNNANSVTAFYRKFIKPSVSTILDEYRYNNMLSNPRTHIRNAFSNLVQTFITRPATILAQGDIKGTAQYYTGAIKNFPTAVDEFVKSFTGKGALGKPDIEYIPSLKLPRFMTIPTRAMEAADKFFSALIKGGESARGTTPEKAGQIAEYSLFRQGLKPEGQGKLLNAIDDMTAWTYKAPKIVRWFVPFIRTPMNFAKQWIEYSPAGLATLPGSNNQKEQLAKTMVGSVATAVGAHFALSGNTTWDAPTDPKQKELFYASGKKPFSVRIGDKWVSMMYAGPFAAALALPAAMKYYQDENRTALTDNQLEKATKSVMSMAKFLSGQTFLQGINNFVKFFSGDVDYSIAGNLAFTAGQLIPMEGLVRYISTIVDPIYRKGTGFGESLQKNIPFLSKGLPSYNTPEGLPSTREPQNYLTPYDITTNKSQYDPLLQERQNKLQDNAVKNQVLKQAEAGKTKENSQYFPVKTDTGHRLIDLTTPLKEPTSTGQSELDKQLMQGYINKLGLKQKDVVDLVGAGELTPEQGNNLIFDLKQKQAEVRSKMKSNKPTGQPVLDREIIKKQANQITSQISQVTDYVQAGKLSPQQGAGLVNDLITKQKSLRFKIAKPKSLRLKITKPRKLPLLKIPTGRKMKVSKVRIPKQKIKIPRVKKIKI